MSRIFLSLFLIFPGLAWAQSGNVLSDTITWSAASDKNLKTGDTFVRDITFVSYDSARIELIQNSHARSMDITSVEGSWPDVSQPGQILFHILFGDNEGTVTILRDENGLSLTLDLSISSPDGVRNQYFIDHISVN